MEMDKEVQTEILRKLEEYSESFLNAPQSKKKKRSPFDSGINQQESKNVDSMSRRKKKKLKRKAVSYIKEELDINMSKKKKIKSEKKQLKLLKMELDQIGGRDELSKDGTESMPDDLPVVKQKSEPEVVVFHSKRKRISEGEAVHAKDSTTHSREDLSAPVFDMKMARLDVQKFGIKGFEGLKKEEAMTSLMVKLGAKPPKSKFVNYKDYQEKVKNESEEKRNKKELDRKLGFKVRSSNKKDRKKVINKNDVGEVAGQVGNFKNGVLFVKKKDLVGMNKSRNHK